MRAERWKRTHLVRDAACSARLSRRGNLAEPASCLSSCARPARRVHRAHRPRTVHRELVVLVAERARRRRLVDREVEARAPAAERGRVALARLAQRRRHEVAPGGLRDRRLDGLVQLGEALEQLDGLLGDQHEVAHVAEAHVGARRSAGKSWNMSKSSCRRGSEREKGRTLRRRWPSGRRGCARTACRR